MFSAGTGRRVHPARGFVEQEHVGVADRDRRDGHPLTLPAREGSRVPVGDAGQVERIEPPVDRAIIAAVEESQRLGDLLPDGGSEQQAGRVLGNVGAAAGCLDATPSDVDESGECPQERRLAGTVATQQGDRLPRTNLDVDAVEDGGTVDVHRE